ncbi:MAG: tRNA (guanine(46)-N(7))-methyltransferase TrmB [Proteobacteria bacterium]|nr:tRNA (guanine(46)-N(7))-methyltransferase TrmB [Pseudomonadota bacterium]
MGDKRPSHGFHFYGRRHGRKLRPRQAEYLKRVLAEYAIAPPAKNQPIDLASLFAPSPRQLYLEIGFGGGEHLAAIAGATPEAGFIGAEPFINGVASIGRHIAEAGLENIRVWADDVRLLLPMVPEASLDGVYVLFPDPWPKTRHRPRRIIQPTMLDRLAACIKKGGFLLLASDDATAKSWLLEVTCQHRQFAWQAKTADDWRLPPDGTPPTRYMQKASRHGRTPSWFLFLRV